MTAEIKGLFTFRFAAVCFGLSAAFELAVLSAETPLFGRLVGAPAVSLYHLMYVVLFLVVGAGLWRGARFGYYTLFVTAVIYTVDRVQAVFVGDVAALLVRKQLMAYEHYFRMLGLSDALRMYLEVFGIDYFVRMSAATAMMFVLGWWGFVGFAYYRREYFGIRRS